MNRYLKVKLLSNQKLLLRLFIKEKKNEQILFLCNLLIQKVIELSKAFEDFKIHARVLKPDYFKSFFSDRIMTGI